MGIVHRQSIKQTLVTYAAFTIGAINVLVISPALLDQGQFGIISFVENLAVLTLPFVSLGTPSLMIRFFPRFRDEAVGHQGFLGLMGQVLLVGLAIFFLLVFLFSENITNFYASNGRSELYLQYMPYALPLIIFMSFNVLLTQYSSNFQRIVVPTVFTNLLTKLVKPILIVLFAYGIFSFTGIFNLLVITYGVATVALLLYVRHLGQLFLRVRRAFLTKKLKWELGEFGIFSLLSSTSSVASTHLDIFMVGSMLAPEQVAIYTIPAMMNQVIDVPRKAIESITNPLLADAFQRNAQGEIFNLYQKTALNQLIIALFIILGIWLSIDDLYRLIPKGASYAAGKYVFFWLAMATLVDMATGINNQIIAYSKYFRYSLLMLMVLAGVNITMNLFLIPRYGIVGAAMSTFVSKAIFNIVKTVFVWIKFGIQPFNLSTFGIILLSVFVFFVARAIPSTSYAFLDILVRSVTIGVLFPVLLYQFGFSEDVNKLLKSTWDKVFK